jgi:hypothetical protein
LVEQLAFNQLVARSSRARPTTPPVSGKKEYKLLISLKFLKYLVRCAATGGR